jgi:hypothetical protein
VEVIKEDRVKCVRYLATMVDGEPAKILTYGKLGAEADQNLGGLVWQTKYITVLKVNNWWRKALEREPYEKR